ncbi:MAG: hypothetical protein GTN56_01670 [Xanthomonadales bacterium]|nr:hypothetical protein [Xanthomonadales bacterium]NIN73825.1 hypothetical protein [Xanthomonadales bacterium]NIP10929.1 hypothetical protein [Xanthomonadales bacterium]NIT07233.1 hypothetical protein [Xanthomonadales bacterium]NIT32709.1 hypothetical protein [Xanthomonadales bacterium]
MKTSTMIAVTAFLFTASPMQAAEESQEHESHHPDVAVELEKDASAMPGGSMPMHDMMQKMRSQMMAIHESSDPDQRDELTRAHMDSMREMMNMMQEMHGSEGMMGMKGRMMMGGKPGDEMAPAEGEAKPMMPCRKQMQQRMDMMQMMMGQMMQNQAARDETRALREQAHDHPDDN